MRPTKLLAKQLKVTSRLRATCIMTLNYHESEELIKKILSCQNTKKGTGIDRFRPNFRNK